MYIFGQKSRFSGPPMSNVHTNVNLGKNIRENVEDNLKKKIILYPG